MLKTPTITALAAAKNKRSFDKYIVSLIPVQIPFRNRRLVTPRENAT